MTRALLLASLLALVPPGPGLAQDDWAPPEPSPESLDWLKLNSGEWLRGEIQYLSDENLEFDSEELDLLHLDWGDVAELRSPRILTYAFEDDTRHYPGTATMRDGRFQIRVGDEVLGFPRDRILTIIEGRPREINFWSAKLGLGLIGRSGNTDQADLNSTVIIRRRSTRAFLDVQYLANYSETNSVRTVENQRAEAKFDYLISKGFFITPAAGGLFSDAFQNIDLRWTAAAGLGYFLVRRSGLDWNVQLGGGYLSTRFVSVQPGEEEEETSGNLTFATSLEMDLTGDLELDLNYNTQVTIPDPEGTIHHAFALFSYEWTSLLDLDFSFTWDRVKNPKRDAEGNLPKKDDFRTSVGIGLDF